jgi:murein L,D-transpeptidase YafK
MSGAAPARRSRTAEKRQPLRHPTAALARPFLFLGAISGDVGDMVFGRLGTVVAFVAIAITPGPAAAAVKIDLVRVDKSERRMELLAKGEVVRSYAIALGGNPVGHKQQQGDQRTPEGRYVLDWQNPKSCCFRSLHVSYPNAADKAAAKRAGVDPGGMIMIHGQVNGFGWWGWLFQMFDWTDGCIAVTDEDMREIWDMVPVGTAIEINP